MKKILAWILALMLALSLTACGGKDGPKPSGSSGDDKEPGSSQQAGQPDDITDPGDSQAGEQSPDMPDDTADPGASQAGEQPSDTPEDNRPEEPLSVDEVLAEYGFTEDTVKPDEAYTEVTVEEQSYVGDYRVTFAIDGEYMDGDAYIAKLFQAIEAVSDGGKVYSMSQEFLDGTGGEIDLGQVEVYNNQVTLGYIYGGTKIMVRASVASIPSVSLQLAFSAKPDN